MANEQPSAELQDIQSESLNLIINNPTYVQRLLESHDPAYNGSTPDPVAVLAERAYTLSKPLSGSLDSLKEQSRALATTIFLRDLEVIAIAEKRSDQSGIIASFAFGQLVKLHELKRDSS